MSDDALSGAVNPEELQLLRRRHPALGAALDRLRGAMEEALIREATTVHDKPALVRFVAFFLGHQAVDDFWDIVLLAAHARGFGAMKLLRPLYERVVTARYLMGHPDEVQSFNDYADVNTRQLINHGRMIGVPPTAFMSQGQLAEVEETYGRVSPQFTETLCAKCGTTRIQSSWTKKSLKALADDVGLGHLYGGASFWPTMQLHTTRMALESRLTVAPSGGVAFTHRPQREQGDLALKHAHMLIVALLHECNRFFGWGIDLRGVVEDGDKCWRPDGNDGPRGAFRRLTLRRGRRTLAADT